MPLILLKNVTNSALTKTGANISLTIGMTLEMEVTKAVLPLKTALNIMMIVRTVCLAELIAP